MNSPLARPRHQIFAVSDATGTTAELVVRAALAQFQMVEFEIRRVPNIRTVDEVRRVMEAARASGTVVVHTLVSDELRQAVLTEGGRLEVATIDLLGQQIHLATANLLTIGLVDKHVARIGCQRGVTTHTRHAASLALGLPE